MEENIAPTDKNNLTTDARRPSYSAPTLGTNDTSSSSSDFSNIKESSQDINSKQKHHRHEKSHKDFPEIRAYYANIAKDGTSVDNISTESFSSNILKKQDEISPYSEPSLKIPTSLPVAPVSEPDIRNIEHRDIYTKNVHSTEFPPRYLSSIPINNSLNSFTPSSLQQQQQQQQHQQQQQPIYQDNTGVFEVDLLAALSDGDDGRYTRYASSADSMLALIESRKYNGTKALTAGVNDSQASIQTNVSNNNINALHGYGTADCPYPAWGPEDAIPVTYKELETTFIAIGKKFGFQHDSVRNMIEHLMIMLDSRASRITPQLALDTLHADYIGGDNANYRKWYFASQMDMYEQTEQEKLLAADIGDEHEQLRRTEEKWMLRMRNLTNHEKLRDLALYLLLWGEAAPVRFTPETLCFIYKVAYDYYCHVENQVTEDVPEGTYLDGVVTPLYNFFRDQTYVLANGKYAKREKDHDRVIGYDDVNQFFWHSSCYDRILVGEQGNKPNKENTLGRLPPEDRYNALRSVNWKKTFTKTYKEKRSWMHASINFSRVWVIHIVTFWYYIMANAYSLYLNVDKEVAKEEVAVQISIVALGGVVACFLVLVGSCAELAYLPVSWHNSKYVLRRIVFLFILMIINAGPSFYCIVLDRVSWISKIVAIVQLLVSIATTLFLSIVPSSRLFMRKSQHTREELANESFTANFPPLKRIDRIMSICLWICVFSCKLLESYFFLALSFKDPLTVISTMNIINCHDRLIGSMVCEQMPRITIAIMFLMDLVLYFLDTYLWYIIWNTAFSVSRSFYLGISIWSPWRNIFASLPKRIFVKLLATPDIQVKYKPKVLCSQIWNAIVITMYREHLITVDHAQRMLYQQEVNPLDGQRTLKAPTFFVTQEDTSFKTEYFPQHGEAERRIHFFAQSLTTPMPPSHPVECMPTFTVLTPHYGEKILLSLREIIREEDNSTRVTLLEYLKQLHTVEWDNFVKDTKMLVEDEGRNSMGARHQASDSDLSGACNAEKELVKSDIDDLPFYCIGFKSSKPEYTLRTRIWASLRAQTLYRTVSGFMNYKKAIKLLYRVENPETVRLYQGDKKNLDQDLDRLARRKFKFLVAMQRYAKFNPSEAEDAEFLFKAFPELQVAYIDEVPPVEEGGEITYYSALIDGFSEINEAGKRVPRYRVRLPGNPILGDGKSDNQNHAIIFYRGEFLQLIDANQDNYLEECLKIRNVLGEFETLEPSHISPYSAAYQKSKSSPVAIVGAREYIFSENVGVLGDVAAGKEQTFGTLTQRIMAKIGGKLHYGHPDFLNAIFMNTRGGVSKAQKGLHLNEDIYAGMNAFTRGGRIKHTEYFQCGKGRDLGFGSILNFTTKIGTGMGEQMLSREYYYIGTQLPLDRFLTFYYAHPGFHINNIFIMMSVQMFMLAILFISAMGATLTICEYNADAPPEAPLIPEGCYNLVPIFDWVKRCILSIFVVFFAAFLPLFLQELTERGFWRSLTRMGRHFISLSPLFEIFVTQIYTNSVLENLVYGGAMYIGTGRGFATSRIPFSTLYSRFTGPSIYIGARNFVIMLFASIAYWIPHLLYFWFTVVALMVSPFVFNPNQFSPIDFLVDYKEFIRWLSRGNSNTHKNSWINHTRSARARITGYKRSLPAGTTTTVADLPRLGLGAIFVSEVILPLIYAILCTIPYGFIKSFDSEDSTLPATGPSPLIRIGVMALGPILVNTVGLMIFFGMSVGIGSIVSIWVVKFGSIMAACAHAWSVINVIIFFEVFFMLEEWKLLNVVLGIVSTVGIQRFVIKLLTVMCLTREFKQDESNRGWWTGKWYGRGLGWHAITQPAREFICKIIEMTEFSTDFLLGHVILFFLSLFIVIPYVNTAHSLMLFWLRPSQQIRSHIWTAKQQKKRKRVAICYGIMFYSIFLLFIGLIVAPMILGKSLLSGLIDVKSLPI